MERTLQPRSQKVERRDDPNSPWSKRRVRLLKAKTRRAVTLIELLCVLTIIAILPAMYLPAMARAFGGVKKFLFNE